MSKSWILQTSKVSKCRAQIKALNEWREAIMEKYGDDTEVHEFD